MVFDRYLFFQVFAACFLMTLTLAVIIMLTQSLRFLELVIEAGASGSVFWVLSVLALPRFLEVVIPIALMASTLFVYNRLLMDSELVVMRAAGYSPLRLSRPVLWLSVFISLFLLFVTSWLAPTALNQMQQMRQMVRAEYSSILLREGVFNSFGPNLTVYIDDRLSDGQLRGILIHDTNPDWEQPVTIMAERGEIIMQDNTQKVVVYDGWRQAFNPNNNALQNLSFVQYTVALPEGEDPRVRWQEPDERTLFELFHPDPDSQRDLDSAYAFDLEIHRRILSPFLAPSFTMVALCFLLLGTYNRRGQSVRIGLGVFTIVLLQGLYLFSFNLAGRTELGLIGMYLVVVLPLILGLFALSPAREKIRNAVLSHAKAQSLSKPKDTTRAV